MLQFVDHEDISRSSFLNMQIISSNIYPGKHKKLKKKYLLTYLVEKLQRLSCNVSG